MARVKSLSRAQRCAEATEALQKAATSLRQADFDVWSAQQEFDALHDELQRWFDGLTENLASSATADRLQEAIASLEEVLEAIESLDIETAANDIEQVADTAGTIAFPGMFGR